MSEIVDEPTIEYTQSVMHEGNLWDMKIMSNGLVRLYCNGFYVESLESTMEARQYILND